MRGRWHVRSGRGGGGVWASWRSVARGSHHLLTRGYLRGGFLITITKGSVFKTDEFIFFCIYLWYLAHALPGNVNWCRGLHALRGRGLHALRAHLGYHGFRCPH